MRFSKDRQTQSQEEGGCHHHYAFAHVALRSLCHQSPLVLFKAMELGRCFELLRFVWKRVRERNDKDGLPTFGLGDIRVKSCRIKDRPAITIQMPPPVRMTDAHFIGVVLTAGSVTDAENEHARCRYFTLEKNWKKDGSPVAFLCEWMPDRSHNNYALNVPPEEAAFTSAIEGVI